MNGLRVLADHDLVHNLLARTRELPAATQAATSVDRMSFVLDHAAKPPIATCELEPWPTRLAELARRPNVACKVSGLITEADWDAWSPEELATYVAHVVELLTPQRLMFGRTVIGPTV